MTQPQPTHLQSLTLQNVTPQNDSLLLYDVLWSPTDHPQHDNEQDVRAIKAF